MDAFSDNNQIQMAFEDEEKITFTTYRGLFCYKIISFGLKNVDATYQYLINTIFKDQIGWNIEVYMDDILVKSKFSWAHIDDLKEAFTTLWKYKKLNSTKYAFKVASEKFLWFMVLGRGIEVNPKKI